MINKIRLSLTIGVAMTVLTACGGSGGTSKEPVDADLGNIQKVLETNADIAFAAYSDSVSTARALASALKTFRENPTQQNFDAAKRAWLIAREPYGQTEVYRFRGTPIDDADGPEGDINAWPLGEALIDYVITGGDFRSAQIGVVSHSTAVADGAAIDENNHDQIDANGNRNNIIGDLDIVIDENLLENTATAEDEHDVIAGYHAIEFLLWGQDLNNNAQVTHGNDREQAVKANTAPNLAMGGLRPLSDFDEGYNDTDRPYDSTNLKHRRHKYLEVAVEKLIKDLESVRDEWADGVAGNYRDQFTNPPNDAQARQRLAEILTGMGTLSQGELAGERMQIAFSSNSQEDEHSCFSDNTHRDIVLNALGVANSYYGTYQGYDSDLDGDIDSDDAIQNAVNGYGIDDYLMDEGLSSLASQLESALTTTENHTAEIDAKARNGEPVDVLIQSLDNAENNPMYQTIRALDAQATLITQLAETLDIDADVVDAEGTSCDTSDPDSTCS